MVMCTFLEASCHLYFPDSFSLHIQMFMRAVSYVTLLGRMCFSRIGNSPLEPKALEFFGDLITVRTSEGKIFGVDYIIKFVEVSFGFALC